MTLLILIVALLLGSAFFAGTELAVTMASRVRLRTRAADGERRAAWAEGLLRRRERTIAVCLVGNNLVNVALAVYGREALLRFTSLSEAWVDVMATALVVSLVVVFGEIVPKAVSQSYPNRILVATAAPLYATRVLLAPLLLVAVAVAEAAQRAVGVGNHLFEFATREELKQFVVRSEVRGHVDPEERGLIHHIVEFWKLDPHAFIQPLETVAQVTDAARVGAVKEIMRERGVTRVLVTNLAGDAVVGVVSATHLMALDNDTPVTRPMRRPVRADLDHGLERVLADLQRSPSQTAVVRRPDASLGIIRLDDLLRRLLGDNAARQRVGPAPRGATGARDRTSAQESA